MSDLKLVYSEDTQSEWNRFLEWVETTTLYNTILHQSSTVSDKHSSTIRVHEPDGSITELRLNGATIKQAADLPKEILAKFYQNWPEKKTILPKQLSDNENISDSSSRLIESPKQ